MNQNFGDTLISSKFRSQFNTDILRMYELRYGEVVTPNSKRVNYK